MDGESVLDVVVVGAGPTGLMLAGELAGAGVRTGVLERRAEPSQAAKAGGLAGQVLQLLHLRGELARFRAASPHPDVEPPPRFPFGGLHLDFTGLDDPPMRALLLPQPDLEALLAERAVERGAEVRRGHEVVGLEQDDDAVTLTVRGPDGDHGVAARFVVGCDGGRSRVRELVGIPFAGTALPEVERLASTTLPDGVTALDDGGIDVGGTVVPFGYTATAHGVFACAATGGTLSVYTAEVEEVDRNDDAPMDVADLAASVRRVLGIDLPLGEPLRMTRFGYAARQADTYRAGRVFLAGDAAHLFPAGGVAVNAGMLDAANLAWKLAEAVAGRAADGLLDSYTSERRAAAERTLLHTRAQVALRRGHGPGADALRALVQELADDEPALLRLGALMAGTDVGGEGAVLTDRMLGVAHLDPRFEGLLAAGRPVLLDLADRPELRAVAGEWGDRVDVVTVVVPEAPTEALLVLPDGWIGWRADAGDGATGLRAALACRLGPGQAGWSRSSAPPSRGVR